MCCGSQAERAETTTTPLVAATGLQPIRDWTCHPSRRSSSSQMCRTWAPIWGDRRLICDDEGEGSRVTFDFCATSGGCRETLSPVGGNLPPWFRLRTVWLYVSNPFSFFSFFLFCKVTHHGNWPSFSCCYFDGSHKRYFNYYNKQQQYFTTYFATT